MIYKIILFLFISISILPCYAVQKGSVEYNGVFVDYSKINYSELLKSADSHFSKFETDNDLNLLTTSMGEYYILAKVKPNEIYPVVQLARTYDITNRNRKAKEYFSKGLNIDKNNPLVNYYFGDFYYKRAEYKKALKYFTKSYANGYDKYYDLNLKIATIYEKFADLERAKYYYNRAFALNPSAYVLKDKVLELESLGYDKSEYYKKK